MSIRDALVRMGILGSAADRARREVALCKIAEANGRVRVRGHVRGAEAPLIAPFTGREVVFWAAEHRVRTLVTRETSRGGQYEEEIWRQLFRSAHTTTFDVVDEASSRARIVLPTTALEAPVDDPFLAELEPGPLRDAVKEAAAITPVNSKWIERRRDRVTLENGSVSFELCMTRITETDRLNDPPPELDTFFRTRGVSATRYMGLLRENRFLEATLAIGREVEVIGNATVGRNEVGDGYRGGEPIVLIAPEFVFIESID